ncbi:MAG: putA [Rickettsiales bacterium]|nr:putA [Rickettsiales bacterium]
MVHFIDQLLLDAKTFIGNAEETRQRAITLIEAARDPKHAPGAIERFMQHHGFDTPEGLSLMCLAEALLRIPDDYTVDLLLRDKLSGLKWKYNDSDNGSRNPRDLAQALDTALTLASSLLSSLKPEEKTTLKKGTAFLKNIVSSASEPVIRAAFRHAMEMMGEQFVLAQNLERAITEKDPRYLYSFDMLGEGARTHAHAEHFVSLYSEAIKTIGTLYKDSPLPLMARDSISIKLSALHPRFTLTQYDRLRRELLPRLKMLVQEAMQAGIMVTIDAEESFRLDLTHLLLKELLEDPCLQGFEGIGIAVQAYQLRAPEVLDGLIATARATNRRIPVRLVKGAYWDSEIKFAQNEGLDGYPVYTTKEDTDIAYLACALKMLSAPDAIYPQFGTHNAYTIAAVMQHLKEKRNITRLEEDYVGRSPDPKDVAYSNVREDLRIGNSQQNSLQVGLEGEFQRLHGMGEALYGSVVDHYPCRIYAPIGSHKELLPYLIRRLLENGANTSFVKHLSNPRISAESLTHNPVALKTEIHSHFPLPVEIYGTRKNSLGVDMGSLAELQDIGSRLAPHRSGYWKAYPTIGGKEIKGTAQLLYAPSHTRAPMGEVVNATLTQCDEAIRLSLASYSAWDHAGGAHRAEILERAGDLLEAKRDEAIALCIREAGKTLKNAVSEVREAIDFCRYYAVRGRELFIPMPLPGPTGETNILNLHGRGVFVCISPWNFPLAIFTGQVTAALMAGNAVIAKPAAQTPLIAAWMVKLLHEAGVPGEVLHFLPGSGGEIGQALIADPRIAGVCFTGSTKTAQHINQTLANRNGPIIPLIAETGGQNAMIIDSSALLEQAVDDVMLSAFDSAGQRCSALRVAYVQEECADAFITTLQGALTEQRLGDPWEITTDIGPVIDQKTKQGLLSHIHEMKDRATLLATGQLPSALEEMGSYLAPHVFEIENIHMLDHEVFGPVLHIIRFKAKDFEKVVYDINSTGFGLTSGLHSRITARHQYMRENIHAGNFYINRSMIGATVGTQPFGGEGLSGTGPKAGGPYYLLRFATERTVTDNIAAIGGNVGLLL